MGFGDVIEEIDQIRKGHNYLHGILAEHLAVYNPNKKMPGPDDWLGASKVPLHCPRFHVMAYRMGITNLIDEYDIEARWRMDRGTSIHRIFQELWLGPLGWMYGGWRCPRCAKLHVSRELTKEENHGGFVLVTPETAIPMPEVCKACDHKSNKFDPFQYVEPWTRNYELKVWGPVDGILMLPGHSLEFFDLKTTKSLKWVRREPRPHDVKQLHWYMDAYDIRRGRLIYLDPGALKFEDAMVEHIITFDPQLMHEEKEKIRGLREALKNPLRPIPACPYGGKIPFGDCKCIELEVFRSRAGD